MDVGQYNAGCVESHGLFEDFCQPDVDTVNGAAVDHCFVGDVALGVEKEAPQLFLIEGIKGCVDVFQEMIGGITGRTDSDLFTDNPSKSAASFRAVSAWPSEGSQVIANR